MVSGSGVRRRVAAQHFDNNGTDSFTNYIRFWQADGESEKTSIRTKTALGQLVEDGGFKGGLAPYGYNLVKSGRFNKRKHEVFELTVNEAEAAVVRIIFDKYVHEGFGAQRIATYLNNLGYRAYINFYQAKAIVEYRKKKGSLTSLKPFSLYEEFTKADLERISHYVCFE